DMPLLVLGINHNTAAVDVRERVAFAPDRMHEALNEACSKAGLNEAVILSTCNRTEVYGIPGASGDDPEATRQRVLDWLCTHHGLPKEQVEPVVYSREDADAVRHLM